METLFYLPKEIRSEHIAHRQPEFLRIECNICSKSFCVKKGNVITFLDKLKCDQCKPTEPSKEGYLVEFS